MNTYRYSLGLKDKYRFGTEIEFSNTRLKELEEKFMEKELPVKYILGHKDLHPDYSVWYLDGDITVSKYLDGGFFGGELSSRILLDWKEYWTELRNICNILRNSDAIITNQCSNHITIDLSHLENEAYFFEILSKIIVLYETELEIFYMGDSYLNRETKIKYANNMSFALLRKINSIDFNKSNFLNDLKFKGISTFLLRDAINLSCYEQSNYKIGKTMEIRYPNGTINEKTIQNNINFSLKLIYAIERELFDKEKLTYMINQIEKDRIKYAISKDPSYNDFENIVKLIATSNEDIQDFMCQYEQVIKTKNRK